MIASQNSAAPNLAESLFHRIADLQTNDKLNHVSKIERAAFKRTCDNLVRDLIKHWTGPIERLNGPAADVLAVFELWLCLVLLEDAYLRYAANNDHQEELKHIVRGRASCYGSAARIIGEFLESLPDGT